MSLRFVRRGAFTLVELLVAMSIIVVLASLTLLVVTSMGERDGTTDAAGLTRQWLMIAKNRASRDKAPRGLRLIVARDQNNVAKDLGPNNGIFWVTECQYIEAPPIVVTYPSLNTDVAPTGSPADPIVAFTYVLSPSPPYPVAGVIIERQCRIANLKYADVSQLVRPGSTTAIQPNLLLELPTLGTSHRIRNGTLSPPLNVGYVGPYTVTMVWNGVQNDMETWPDSPLGAAGVAQPQPQPAAGPTPPCFVTQLFGITSPPRPLMAEPPLPLPRDICIDVSPLIPLNGVNPPYAAAPSFPQGAANTDYDILFSPNGHVLPVGAGAQADGMIFLWHRDYTKLRNAPYGNYPLVVTSNSPLTLDMYPFQKGGDHQVVAIRCKTGSLGQFPVQWPAASGQYASPNVQPYYDFARTGTTSP